MKCLLYTLTIVMLLQSASFGTLNFNAPKAASVPAIDGDISTGWEGALNIYMAFPDITTFPNEGTISGNPPTDAADLSADVYVMWDVDNLYVAARVYDSSLNFRQAAPGPFNGQDCFQLAFNPYDNPVASFLGSAPIYDLAADDVNGDGPCLFKHEGTLYMLPNAEIGGQVLADGYIVELKAPWSDWGIAIPKASDVHGIGFLIPDFEEGQSSADSLLFDYGSGVVANLGVPTTWNTITLVGDNGCGLNGLPPGDLNGDCVVSLGDVEILASQWFGCTDPMNLDCIKIE